MEKGYERLLAKVYRDSRYRGKQVLIIGVKIFAASTERQAVKLFDRLTKAFPNQTPFVTFIPKADTLILGVP